ncbi:small, acid-soluble spore protein, alpha/beta type, partial [Bacillus mycoides]
MANTNSGSRNELLVRGAENAIDQMKYEIAQEFGVQ